LARKPKGKRPLEDLIIDGKIILKWNFFANSDEGFGLDSCGS
jgi:hypothetical protein